MPTLEEMTSWSLDEIRLHIQRHLPADHQFFVEEGDFGWKVRFEAPDGAQLWEQVGFDERVVLLDAFGWLWLRKSPTEQAPGSPWVRRPDLRQEHVVRPPTTEPDPEDLDPDEVLAVYGYERKKS